MILYFTGTGNSKYVADALADRLEDGVCSLNDVLKGQGERAFFSEKPFVVVAPIYAWRLPRVIEALLLQSRFSGTRKLYFIATMGAQSGSCDRYCKNICDRMEMEYMGFCGISMPDNFVYASVMADQETVDRMLQAAKPQIAALAQAVLPVFCDQ